MKRNDVVGSSGTPGARGKSCEDVMMINYLPPFMSMASCHDGILLNAENLKERIRHLFTLGNDARALA
jgi:hypothetical protein